MPGQMVHCDVQEARLGISCEAARLALQKFKNQAVFMNINMAVAQN